jgi:tripartite-type tricarboxylate transporter receptor subunit TctC
MKLPRRQFLRLAVGAAVLPALSHIARAQTYPARPITIVVPFAAGGPTDTIGRLLAERLRSSLGQTVIVENATARAARAAPDGYTISLGQNGSHVVTGAAYSNLPYDLLNDFEPLTLICIAPFIIVARKTMPANDLKELVAWLKANPDKWTMGNAGQGSISQVCGLIFQNITGTRLQFVPYRGTAPAMQDLVAGQIDLMISDPVTSMPQVRAGNIKSYGVTADIRLSSAPDIPTVDEAGLPSFHVALWHGLWMPKSTPKTIIAKLNTAVVAALADPAAQAKLAELGQEIYPRAPADAGGARRLAKG